MELQIRTKLHFKEIDSNPGTWYTSGKRKPHSKMINAYARIEFLRKYEEMELPDRTWAVRRKTNETETRTVQ